MSASMDINSFRECVAQLVAAYESVYGGVGAGPSPVNLPSPSGLFEKADLSEKCEKHTLCTALSAQDTLSEISSRPLLPQLVVPRHLISKAVEGSSQSPLCTCGELTGTKTFFEQEVGLKTDSEASLENARHPSEDRPHADDTSEDKSRMIEDMCSDNEVFAKDAELTSLCRLPDHVEVTVPFIKKKVSSFQGLGDLPPLVQKLASDETRDTATGDWIDGGFHAIMPNTIVEPDSPMQYESSNALEDALAQQTTSVKNKKARQRTTTPTAAEARWANLVVPLIEKRRRLAMRSYWEENGNFGLGCYQESDDNEGDAVSMSWYEKRTTTRRRSSLISAGSVQVRQSGFGRLVPSYLEGLSLEYFVISPLSWKKSVWMLMGASVVFVDFFMLTLTVFGLSLESGGAIFWDYFNGFFWSLDMLMVFFTGLYIKLEVVTSLPHIARHYISRWFIFDACMLSIQWGLIIADMGDTKKVKWLKYVKFGKYARLLRMAKIEGLVTKALEVVNSVHMLSLIKICGHLLLVVLYIHCMATAWYGSSTRMGDPSWAADSDGNKIFIEFPLNYFMALHWTVAQLQGTCDIYPGHTAGERAWATVHVFTSVVVMAILFGNLAALMHQMVEMKGKKERWVNTARHYLEDHHISKELSLRVRKYVQWLQVHNTTRDRDQDELLHLLPFTLRSELLEESRSPIVSSHVVFTALRSIHPRSWQRLICDALVGANHLPGDFLFSHGHICESMRFVVRGEARYYRYDEFLQSVLKLGGRSVYGSSRPMNIRDLVDRTRLKRSIGLSPGDTCCEASLWVDWVHCGDASAVDQVQVFKLKFQDFKDMMQIDPATKALFVRHAFRFSDVINSFGKDRANDLTTSDDVMELSILLKVDDYG